MIFKSVPLICLLCLLLPETSQAGKPVQVFVSIPPQQYLVERIGRSLVDVKVMLKPGHSPETFDPTLKQISELINAQLYFRIGVAFENKWLDSIEQNSKQIKIIHCCENIIESRSISFDNHVWTSVRNAQLLAVLIRQELVNIDPGHSIEYEQNFVDLMLELEQLDDEIYLLLNKRRTDYFVISHAALGHYANDYGLIQLSLENQGKELGARSLVSLIRLARREKIHSLFVQKQHKSAAAVAFANEIDAKIIEIDLLHGDYINNLRSITGMMVEAMR